MPRKIALNHTKPITKHAKAKSYVKLQSKQEALHKAPVAQARIKRTPAPRIQRNSRNGDVVVSHRELVRDVPGSVGFAVNALAINPGLGSTFPWLSQMAQLYESFKFESLKFEFETMSSTSTTGTVMAVVDYDASDAAPVDKSQMATYRGFARSAPWDCFKQYSVSEDLNKRASYYVRSGALSANQDIKLYDVGNFFVATQGQLDTSTVCELYVSYKVKLMTPQLQNPAVGNSKSGKFVWATAGGAPTTSTGTSAPLVPTGTAGATTILTATSAYNCLLALQSTTTGVITGYDFTGSTCTIQAGISVVAGTPANNGLYIAQLAFLPGQVFVSTATGGGSSTATTMSVGQFDTLVIA